MTRATTTVVFGLALCCPALARAGQPWEIKTTGGYLKGAVLVPGAKAAQQFADPPQAGVRSFLAYDSKGLSPLVGEGAATRWEFIRLAPDSFHIRAAEGKWKGWYLNTSERAFKYGPTFGHLLEMGKQPQTFYVYQVGK